MNKSGKLACHVLSSNNAIHSFHPRAIQTSLRFVAIFKKINDGEPILTVFSVIGEDVQHHCFSQVYYVRTVTQPDIDTIFWKQVLFSNTRNSHRSVIVLALSQDGLCTDFFENFSESLAAFTI
jgi:hypothetical protein